MKTQAAWIDKNLFPFESKWITVAGQSMHYIDEGEGDVILFVHGTPEWSFGFRDLIRELRKDFRCIALDHLGFGLSDKPADANYTCQAHAQRLEKFIQQLRLTGVTLVANDFGGGFALSYAIAYPENTSRIVLFNTWMRSLKDDPHYAGPAKMMNTWLGRFLYLQCNFPVRVVMPAAFGNKKKLTKEIHAHYLKALPSARDRIAAYTFASELMNASAWWQAHWDKLDRISAVPTLIFWGLKDKFVPPAELGHWRQRLPQARIIEYPDAGHFVQEEKPEAMASEIRKWRVEWGD